ncbi:MAG: hypothetical protein J6L88_05430 [Clostridia bacterium]|nr:hypothetical protein [Clostridia bacterium]
MLTAYKWIISIIGIVAAVFLFRAAIVNLSRIKKQHYANFGAAMCVFMLIAAVAAAALSGFFLAM